MPLNFSNKVFPRRKSSGNVLDEVQRPSSDGFRVMSQVEVENKKQVQAAEKDKKIRSGFFGSKSRQESVEIEEDTHARNSSLYDNSSSSARFSSTSTLPTSVENSDNIFAPPQKPNPDSRTFSLRGAGRTFTFGGKSSKPDLTNVARPAPPLPNNIPSPKTQFRERSTTTTSYASTAHPPKVDYKIDHDTSGFGSGFDNLFDGLSNSRPAVDKPLPPGPVQRTESEPILALPPKAFTSTRPNAPANLAEISDTRRENNFSPTSWSSQDNLMSSSLNNSPVEERAPPVPPHRDMNNPRMPPEAASPASDRSDSPYRPVLSTSQQNSYLSLPTSYTRKDSTSSELSPKHSFSSISSQDEHTLTRAPAPTRNTAFSDEDESVTSDATPRPFRRDVDDDDDLATSAAAAMSFAERPPANKVMNQAQYNSYRRQQEMRAPSVKSESDSEEENYDEEDEAERQREIARQRRKQEATMSVYRQRMSKMTGEKPMQAPSTTAERPMQRSDSVPTVIIGGDEYSEELADTLSALDGTATTRNGISGKSSSSGASGEESPDEDTPLGILMAHGFPNKNRPPTRTYGAGQPVVVPSDRPLSAGNPRASMMPGAGKSLPPFARGLPREAPNFFGDGLVQPSNRESFALNSHVPAGPAYGGPMPGEQQRSTTLINVIANEERSKAMRRGSPNARSGFGPMMQSNQSMPNFQVSQNMPSMGNGMDMTGMMGMQTPGGSLDPAVAQMLMGQQMLYQQFAQSQQALAAMIQQQQQSMNGMNGMNGMGMNGMNQPMSHMPGMNGMQGGYLGPNSNYTPSVAGRPMSMAPSNSNRASTMIGRPPSTFGLDPSPRTQSMVRPPSTFNLSLNVPSSRQSTFMSGMGANQGYTPSIAPSERSTIGMASRYRAVNTGVNDGASVMSGQPAQQFQQPQFQQPQFQQPPFKQATPPAAEPYAKGKPGRGKAFLNAFKRNTKHEDIEEEDWSDVAQRKSRFLNPDRKNERELKDLWPQDA